MFDKDDYFYTIGKHSTIDKLEAIILSNQDNQQIVFHIPNYIKDFPIHIEPEESLETLCVQRAKYLREKYDYIRLWFSGGCDSTYVLKTFVDNNIHIDEIMSMKSGFVECDWEIDTIAVPYLKSIKHKIPNTKITVKTPTIGDYKDWYKNEYWFEGYKKLGRASKQFSGLRLNEMLESINLYDTKKLTLNLLGLDKPFIMFVNNNWYAYFLDVNVDIQEQTSDNKFCGFYSDDPIIYTKQCHMLKKAIVKTLPVSEYNKVCFWEKKYQPLWNNSIGRIKNNETFIVTSMENDQGLDAMNAKEAMAQKITMKEFPEIYKMYEKGIQNLNAIGDAKWFNKQNAKNGSVGIFADFKCLDKNSSKTVDELFPDGFKV